jgi:hypothetical protein
MGKRKLKKTPVLDLIQFFRTAFESEMILPIT